MEMSGQLHAPAALSPEEEARYPLDRAGLDAVSKRKIPNSRRESNPDRLDRSQSLYRLSYPDSTFKSDVLKRHVHTQAGLKDLCMHQMVWCCFFFYTTPSYDQTVILLCSQQLWRAFLSKNQNRSRMTRSTGRQGYLTSLNFCLGRIMKGFVYVSLVPNRTETLNIRTIGAAQQVEEDTRNRIWTNWTVGTSSVLRKQHTKSLVKDCKMYSVIRYNFPPVFFTQTQL
jgi:hypothetical protein